MREIKFRFWSHRTNSMSPATNMYGLLSSPVLRLIGDGDEDLEAMQFTGLLDKNGQEIYEGDILEDQYGNTAVVLWNQPNAEFLLNDMDEYVRGNHDEPAYVLSNVWVEHEVIGNIYENPELLREDSKDGE